MATGTTPLRSTRTITLFFDSSLAQLINMPGGEIREPVMAEGPFLMNDGLRIAATTKRVWPANNGPLLATPAAALRIGCSPCPLVSRVGPTASRALGVTTLLAPGPRSGTARGGAVALVDFDHALSLSCARRLGCTLGAAE